jgi:predicted methyltransferase/rhodanese-related sulfurtransferase
MTRTARIGMTMTTTLVLTAALPWAQQAALAQLTALAQQTGAAQQAASTQQTALAQEAGKDWLEQTRKYEARREERQRVGDIFAALGVAPGARVADLGAGEGFFTARLAKAVGPTGRVFAIDADAKVIAKLRERVSREGLTNVEVIESTAKDTRLPAASLDAALIVNAYHEMAEYQAVLAEVRRALTPDGSLVIVEPLESLKRQAPRADQVKVHNIGANHVVQDLREAGFGIASLQDPFIRRGSLDEEWLVVARPLANLTRRPSTSTSAAVDDVAQKLSASTRIYIDEFKALHDSGNVLVIDVRDKESYRTGRIPGALLIPSEKLADYIEPLRAERRLIVAYCSCPAEETSLPVVQKLAAHGITNAKALVGGYRLWVAEKNPIAKGDEPCNGPLCPTKSNPTSDAMASLKP